MILNFFILLFGGVLGRKFTKFDFPKGLVNDFGTKV